jgi:hypothetical protein
MIRLRAEIPGFGNLPTGRAAVDDLHAVLRGYKSGEIRIPARQAADDVVAEFDKTGGTVDLEPVLNRMQDFMLEVSHVEKETAKTIKLATKESGTKLSEVGGEAYKPLAGGKGRMGSRGIARGSETKILKQSDTIKDTVKTEMVEVSKPRTVEAAEATVYDPDIGKVISALYANVRNYLDAEGVDIRNAPGAVGEKVKRMFQQVGNSKVAYGEYKVTDQASSAIKQFGRLVRSELESKIDESGIVDPKTGKSYSALMSDVSRGKKYVGKVMEGFFSGKTDTQKAGRALRTMKTLFGDTGREYLDAVEMMDRELGTSVYEKVRQAAIGKALGPTFGKGGAPHPFPRFTAQGKFLNPLPTPAALMTGGGYATMGPAGALTGAAFASPYGQLALNKGAMAVGRLSTNALKYADKAAAPIRQGMQAVVGSEPARKISLTTLSAARGSVNDLDDE